jgi:anti-anti-sigma regulatory factor
LLHVFPHKAAKRVLDMPTTRLKPEAQPFFALPAVSAPSTILVGRVGELFWVRVEGKGTFQNSLQVKDAFERMTKAGVRAFVVDLERCPIMDSTFLGTLTGAFDGTVSVVNANPHNLQLMTSLGLDYILDVDSAGEKFLSQRRQVTAHLDKCAESSAATRKDQAEHVLEAHQALADLSEDNQCRFQDVIEFLEKELESRSGG